MKITVREVAQAAGVSMGTVSRVLRGSPGVVDERRRRVMESVRKLNYTPLRRHLPKNSADEMNGSTTEKQIALVVLGMHRMLEVLPVIATATHGAEAAITQSGGHFVFIDAPKLNVMPPALENDAIGGVILKGAMQGNALSDADTPLIRCLKKLPSVWVLGRPKGCWGDSVSSDDWLVGKLAAEALIAKGHRHLGYLNPKPHHQLFERREASFRWHAEQGGCDVTSLIGDPEGGSDEPQMPVRDVAGVDRLIERLMNLPQRPTAVFTPADSIAALVYRAMAARNLRIGENLSLISCNNEQRLISTLYPSLTTIDIFPEQIGRQAVAQLQMRLEKKGIADAMETLIPPALVEGESIATINP